MIDALQRPMGLPSWCSIALALASCATPAGAPLARRDFPSSTLERAELIALEREGVQEQVAALRIPPSIFHMPSAEECATCDQWGFWFQRALAQSPEVEAAHGDWLAARGGGLGAHVVPQARLECAILDAWLLVERSRVAVVTGRARVERLRGLASDAAGDIERVKSSGSSSPEFPVAQTAVAGVQRRLALAQLDLAAARSNLAVAAGVIPMGAAYPESLMGVGERGLIELDTRTPSAKAWEMLSGIQSDVLQSHPRYRAIEGEAKADDLLRSLAILQLAARDRMQTLLALCTVGTGATSRAVGPTVEAWRDARAGLGRDAAGTAAWSNALDDLTESVNWPIDDAEALALAKLDRTVAEGPSASPFACRVFYD